MSGEKIRMGRSAFWRAVGGGKRSSSGNIGDFMAAFICMLLMTVMVTAYMDSVRMLEEKAEIGQIARKYILRMETLGVMTEADRQALEEELGNLGVSELSLEGTTFSRTEYGGEVVLQIRGKLRGLYDFEEKKVSAAKY